MKTSLLLLTSLLAIQMSLGHAEAAESILIVDDAGDHGPGTLRQALIDVAPQGRIQFAETLLGQTIALTNGEIVIDKDVMIAGPGPADLSISGADASRVFSITNSITVTLSGLTITGGNGQGAINSGRGGAIYNEGGMIIITNCTLSGNRAGNGDGGAIYHRGNPGGTLTLVDSTVADNTASNAGGGIYNRIGDVSVTRSTVSGNIAAVDGGGIYNRGDTNNSVQIVNATIANNTAGGSGGGIHNRSLDNALITLRHSTLAGNGAVGGGGGLYHASGTFFLGHTILGNHAVGGNFGGPNSFASLGYNLSDDDTGTLFLDQSGDRNNLAALLDPNGLQDNGGPTLTLALQPGSPGIDRGNSGILSPPQTDQRGMERICGGRIDIGAVEGPGPVRFDPLPMVLDNGNAMNLTSYGFPAGGVFSGPGVAGNFFNPNLTGPGVFTLTYSSCNNSATQPIVVCHSTLTVVQGEDGGPGSLRQAILDACPGATIEFDQALTGETIFLTSGELLIDKDLTIRGPTTLSGAPNLTVSGNNASRVFYVLGPAHVTLSGLNIIHGNGLGDLDGELGGAVFNDGAQLTVSHCAVQESSALFLGGGIYNGGNLTVRYTTISDNIGFDCGGGIFNDGVLTLTHSTLAYNQAPLGLGGGGLLNAGPLAAVTNCTFFGNFATFSGGGIYNMSGLSLLHSTLSENTTAIGMGGGIFTEYGELSLGHTILANSGDGGNCFNDVSFFSGTVVSLNYNLSDDESWVDYLDQAGDRNNTGSGLSPDGLMDYGGPTLTVAVLPCGTAENMGKPGLSIPGLPTDQRGQPRVTDGRIDIGAFEFAIFKPLPDESTEDGILDLNQFVLQTGGQFSTASSGLADNLLDLTQAGPGLHNLSYAWDDGSGCIKSGMQTIRIYSPAITVTSAAYSGVGTLPWAVEFLSPGGIIDFDPSLFGQTILVARDALTIDKHVNIAGPGADRLTLSGGGSETLFVIRPTGRVSVSDLTVAGAFGTQGGGFSNLGGILDLLRVHLDDNFGIIGGGGIFNMEGSRTTVRDCTFSRNKTQVESGGAIDNRGDLVVTQCTFSENIGEERGGAIYNREPGSALIIHSTFSANKTGTGGPGGALYNDVGAELMMGHTLLADSDSQGTPIDNCVNQGTWISLGYNLCDDSSCIGVLNQATDQNNVPAQLGPLQDNGGPMPTHALLDGSAAMDAGDPSFAPPPDTDQRGMYRVCGSAVDIGAVEGASEILLTPIPPSTVGDPLIDLTAYFSPSGGAFTSDSPGLQGAYFNPALAGPGTHTVTYTFCNGTVDQTISICAPSITVTSTEDSGPGSLRQAIHDSCNQGTIDFHPSLNGQTIVLTSGELEIRKSLTLIGPGANQLTISGGNASRIFSIPVNRLVSIEGLTLENGNSQGSAFSGSGGAVYTDGLASVTFRGVVFNQNRAGNGGAIYNRGGFLKLFNSTLSGNVASGVGGGIWNHSGDITVTNSVLSGNSATEGGGLYNSFGLANEVTFIDSTLSQNTASNIGGGIYNSGTMMVHRVTAHDNTANFGGGGLANVRGMMDILQSTISGNHASFGGGGFVSIDSSSSTSIRHCSWVGNSADEVGGGIWISEGSCTLGHTLLVKGANGSNCRGAIMSLGYNLADDNGADALTGPGDVPNAGSAEVALGPLADNGGLTWTHALLPGNLALDGGDPVLASPPATDQRGRNRICGLAIDIGAYEDGPVAGFDPVPDMSISDGAIDLTGFGSPLGGVFTGAGLTGNLFDPARSGPGIHTITYTVTALDACMASAQQDILVCGPSTIVLNNNDSGPGSLREALQVTCSGGTIEFDPALANQTIRLTSGELLIHKDLTLIGPGADKLTISGNQASRVVQVLGPATVELSGFTIAEGEAAWGGGILNNEATLTLVGMRVSRNKGNIGGGIYNGNGTVSSPNSRLFVIDSTVSNNLARNFAGGIQNLNEATVVRSLVSDNTGLFDVGGISNESDSSSLAVTNSTLSGNSAGEGRGGGVANGGSVIISQSTLAGNLGPAGGGAIFNLSGQVTLRHTILAENSVGGNCVNNVTDPPTAIITSLNYNLSDDDSCSSFLNQTGDLNNLAAQLAPLEDNGGPTLTHALRSDSPAIDAGDPSFIPPPGTDQRGLNRVCGTAVDIGALESGPDIVFNPIGKFPLASADLDLTPYATPVGGVFSGPAVFGSIFRPGLLGSGSSTITYTVCNSTAEQIVEICPAVMTVTNLDDGAPGSLRHLVAEACSGVAIQFDPSLSGQILLLSLGELVVDKDLSIDGQGAPQMILSGNQSSRLFRITGSVTLTLSDLTLADGFSPGNGGAILNETGTLIADRCTLWRNHALVDGGGIYNETGVLLLSQCTFADNAAAHNGAGLFNQSGYLTLAHSTLAGNQAAGDGGGVFNELGMVTITHTLLANHPEGGNCFNDRGTVDSLGWNLSDDNSCARDLNQTGDWNNVPAGLDPAGLLDHGGPTLTIDLLPGSWAIDGGDPDVVSPPVVDQRGLARVVGGAIDIGAVESTLATAFDPIGDGPLLINHPAINLDLLVSPAGGSFSGPGVALSEFDPNLAGIGFHLVTYTVTLPNGRTVSLSQTVRVCPAFHTVSNTDDDGPGSLREAIFDACAGATIVFDPSLNGQTITLGGRHLLIDKDLTIAGPGADLLTLNGNNTSRIFTITNSTEVTLSGLTLANGAERVGPTLHSGGGIYLHQSQLTLIESVLTNNLASAGGGLYSFKSHVEIIDSVISGNVSETDGGGVFSGDVTATNSSLLFLGSTLSQNSCQSWGGGVLHFGGPWSITNCTISGNHSQSEGAGIYNWKSQLVLAHSTFANNTAGSATKGAALVNIQGSVQISHTILAESLIGLNCRSTVDGILSLGHNLSDDDSCVSVFNQPGDINSMAALLGSLRLNGGLTPTHALLPGSPAIDAGGLNSSQLPPFDQRGAPRLIGTHPDIGAFEYDPAGSVPIVLRINPIDSGSIRLAWPTEAIGYVLQASEQLPPNALWTDLAVSPVIVGTEYTVTQTPTATKVFYRLMKR